MTEYTVRWEITLDADSPEAAARLALKIHRDPESMATWFRVTDPKNNKTHTIDVRDV